MPDHQILQGVKNEKGAAPSWIGTLRRPAVLS